MSFRKTGIIAAAFVLGVNAVEAAPVSVEFVFSGQGGAAASYQFSSGGLDLDVTAGLFTTVSGVDQGAGAQVVQHGGGLGVFSGGIDNDRVLDGLHVNEIAIFDFSAAVSLTSLTFTAVDVNDDFRLFTDPTDSGDLSDLGLEFDIPILTNRTGRHDFSPFPLGDLFGVGAKGFDDNFRIKKMTVLYDSDATPTTVPLPATLPLMVSGLALFGFAARRRARS